MCEIEDEFLSKMQADVIRYLVDQMEEAREEEALNEFKESRIRALGFLPQKEIIYNLILPYSREIDVESGEFFAEIAINIGKSILVNELKPACSVWTSRLIKYIKLYGLKFSKEDHISLIKMMYEMLKIEQLDPNKLNKYATLFILLTKKKYLISPEDLTLQWRPLYDKSQEIFENRNFHIGMYQMSSSFFHTFDMLVQCSRPYFPETATAEILAELTPKLAPWATSRKDSAMENLLMYLPLTLPTSKFHLGPGLWFKDFMKLWETCHNTPPWESNMMTLMALLSQNYIGYIDWEPYMSLMFTRILRSFNLPVAYQKAPISKMRQLDTNAVCLWIVSTIVPNSSTMDRLSQLLRVIETYLQSANYGHWSMGLRDFLKRLSSQFVDRLHKERNLKWRSSWEPKAEPHYRLTDEDVENFVNLVLKLLLQAMYSRMAVSDTCATLQYLASMRPDLVVEPLIQRLWDTVESLTEPHKYTCTLQCVASIARPIAMGLDTGCPVGPMNVVPMLLSSLPGLDPNDLKKTMVTMHFILTFCTVVPVVNCSQANVHHNLTEDEVAVCWTTSQFEDFVLQFLDRMFALIECSYLLVKQQQLDVSKSKTEEIAENAIGATATVVLMQCEPNIFAAALHKMYQFISQNTLETTVAGRAAGSLCKAFIKADTKQTLRFILPRLCNSLYVMIDDAVADEQCCTPQLLHTLLMFTSLLEGDGSAMLQYMDNITRVLDSALCIRKKEIYIFASQALANVLHGLSRTFPKEFRSDSHCYGDIVNSLPVRQWGIAPNPFESDIQWHIPTAEELKCAQMLMDMYLSRVLAGLRAFIDDKEEVSKEKMHCHLVTLEALLSCSVFLPLDTSPAVDLVNSKITVSPFMCYTGERLELTCEGGANVRDVVAKVIFQVQDKLLARREDDHECLGALAVIWDNLARIPGRGSRSYVGGNISFFAGTGWGYAALDARYRSLSAAKQMFSGRRGRFKPDYLIRSLLADRTLLQHEMRTEFRNTATITEQTVQIMKYLLTLSANMYSSVRKTAQMRLNHMLTQFSYSYKVIIPDVLRLLQSDPVREHHMLKASLYILSGPKSSPLIIHNDWKVLAQLWPAVVESKKSEKPSIKVLMEELLDLIMSHMVTMSIQVKIPESVKEAARRLIPQDVLQSEETQLLIESGSSTLELEFHENLVTYINLVDKMCSLVQNPRLHWSHLEFAVDILPTLVSLEIPYPESAVSCIFNHLLLHDSIYVRRVAIQLAVYVMEQTKPVRVFTEVDPYVIAQVAKPTETIPGHRADNAWILYDPEDLPTTVEKWQSTTFVDKGTGGYYKWPKKLKVAYEINQPRYDANSGIFFHRWTISRFFQDTDNMKKLIAYLSMQEKTGRERFNSMIYKMFKGLIRNCGYDMVHIFPAHLRTLLKTDDETAHRCASEIIAALIHGTKHWQFQHVEKFWADLTPIIKTSIFYTSKSVLDWATSYYKATYGMDPRRLHQFYTLLIDDILPDVSDNSPETWTRVRQTPAHRLLSQIMCLERIFAFGNFRRAKLCNLMLERLIALGYLSHRFQNIRERIGSLLTCIFELDMKLEEPSVGPHFSSFMDKVKPLLKPLYDEKGEVIPTKLGYNGSPVSNSASGLNLASGSGSAGRSNPASGSNLATDLNLAVPGVSDLPSGSNLAASEKKEEPALLSSSMQELAKVISPQELAQALEKMELPSGSSSPDKVDEINWKFLEALKLFKEEKAGDTNTPLPIQKPAKNGNGIAPNSNVFTENEYDVAVRTLKTVLKCTTTSLNRHSYGGHPGHYVIFSTACAFGGRASQSSTMGKIPADEELCKLSNDYLGVLSQSFHTTDAIAVALQHVTRVLQMKSWLTKMACLNFLQNLVFHHLPIILNQQVFRFYTLSLVQESISDLSPEVRTLASTLLSGFLHCGIVTNESKLVDDLRVKCREIGHVRSNEPARIIKLHSYILGLCSYVEYMPYALAPKLIETFRILTVYINAPSPIPETIRRSISKFRQTHNAEWPTFRLSFTEDELDILSDLQVIPSYFT